VECLVDYHTLAIDQSIFVQPASATASREAGPYPASDSTIWQTGTGDKFFIGGHFYSDKSPVPAVLLAGLYQGLQWSTGLSARQHPAAFCYWITLLTSGVAYVLAVWSVYAMGSLLRLPVLARLALPASFALSTTALTYARQVNNHILLLGLLAPLMLGVLRLAERRSQRWWYVAGLGTLAGLAYTTDLGAGPVFLVCALGLVAYRSRRPGLVAVFIVGFLPWLALHHAINYTVGGTFKPANAVPEYFAWPGCTFDARNMTGAWHHPDIRHFLVYSMALLVGKRGFFGHNLPLFLVLPALFGLLRRRPAERPELLFAACCCGGVWLIYALTSTNYSGACCSIRWFVPLLAPSYYVLALAMRERPGYWPMFLLLSGWGAVLGAIMWTTGPWLRNMVPFYWPIQAAAGLTLFLYTRKPRSWSTHEVSESVSPAAQAA
jgi:hypothetical protein